VRQTAKILTKLLTDGELSPSDAPMIADFRDPEVRAELDIWGEEMGFTLKDINGSMYLIPDTDSDLLSFSIKDIRESGKTIDAFLQCYIIMIILWLLYGGKNNNPKSAVFLQIKDIVKTVDERFAEIPAELPMSMEDVFEINFTQIAATWNAMPVYDDLRRKTKTGATLQACRLLERQRLVDLLDENREIRPKKRLDDLMIGYYLDIRRVKELHALFDGGMLCQN
jgi:antitoxin component of RelBE/YafQ-DinJ toxin-antitoxin module